MGDVRDRRDNRDRDRDRDRVKDRRRSRSRDRTSTHKKHKDSRSRDRDQRGMFINYYFFYTLFLNFLKNIHKKTEIA